MDMLCFVWTLNTSVQQQHRTCIYSQAVTYLSYWLISLS